jgi:ubiquinone/menaquinone biosynthesis C-methylase UbiE
MRTYSRSVKAYYDRRAPEYDEWYDGEGRFAELDRPGWRDELSALESALAALPARRTLDVACGTCYLSRHLRGELVGLDQSPAMVAVARRRVPGATFVEADALAGLPFADASFDRVVTGHFYGHLPPSQRASFVTEARRVARELIIVDSALREDVEAESVQERILNDGSRWEVYKRYFTPDQLVEELGGGRVLHAGRWFLAVASP